MHRTVKNRQYAQNVQNVKQFPNMIFCMFFILTLICFVKDGKIAVWSGSRNREPVRYRRKT